MGRRTGPECLGEQGEAAEDGCPWHKTAGCGLEAIEDGGREDMESILLLPAREILLQ